MNHTARYASQVETIKGLVGAKAYKLLVLDQELPRLQLESMFGLPVGSAEREIRKAKAKLAQAGLIVRDLPPRRIRWHQMSACSPEELQAIGFPVSENVDRKIKRVNPKARSQAIQDYARRVRKTGP